MRWPRRHRLPDDVRRAAALGKEERALASAETVDGDTLVATGDRLVLVSPPDVVWARAWARVDAAGWDHETGVLSVEWLGEVPSALTLAAGTGPRLPEVVRERVESSVVTSQHVQVPDHGGARLVVRRAGEGLTLQVVPDPGTSLDDPALASAVEEARLELVDQVGALPQEPLW